MSTVLDRIRSVTNVLQEVLASPGTPQIAPHDATVVAEKAVAVVKDAMTENNLAIASVKPWWQRPTLWAQIISIIASIAALFGFNIDPETQAQVIAGVVGLNGLFTIYRQIVSHNVSPTAAAKTTQT